MLVQKAYKYRFHPTQEQQQKLNRFASCARWAWNHCLHRRSTAFKRRGESMSATRLSRELTLLKHLPAFSWLKSCPSTVLTQTLRDQDKAFNNFFERRAKYPKYRSKKKRRGWSIRFQMDQRIIERTWKPGSLLKVTGLGELDVRWTRLPQGTPKMVTLSMDSDGRYYVSLAVEEDVQPLPKTKAAVGIDLGLKDFAALSSGQTIPAPRHFRRLYKALARAQRALARKQKGSRRRERQRLKVARLHSRIRNARMDFLHQVSWRVVRDHDLIAIEDLNVKGMARGMVGGKSVLDAGLYEFRRQLTYKAEWYGKRLVVIDRFEPTSKRCSCCGHIKNDLTLGTRDWECPTCKSVHHRDINAARNILASARNVEYTHGADSAGCAAVAA